MFLAYAILAQSGKDFTCHFVHYLSIRLFRLKIKVCAVIVDNRRIPFYDFIALCIEPPQIIRGVLKQKVHETQDVMVFKVRLLEIGIPLIEGAVLGPGVQNSCVSEESVYFIAVKSDL